MLLKLYIEDTSNNIWINNIIKHIPHSISDYNDCNYIISSKIPWGCIIPSLIQDTLNSYIGLSKKVIVFMVSDYNEPVEIPPNVLFFRTGFYKSLKKPNEFLLPYFAGESDLGYEPPFLPLSKNTRNPFVGFCGSITSHPYRLVCINKLKMRPNIKKNFILNTVYMGGPVQQFVKNVRDTHFTLSVRGTGNWSARFYQVLYLGRIPIIVNTDIELPFENKINWSDIIVYSNNENELVDKILSFWNNKDIIQAQIKCREIYDTYLRVDKWCKIITEDILMAF